MTTLKQAIFNEVRTHVEKLKDLSNDDLNARIFHHVSGLRLTFHGFLVLKNIFTVYSFELDVKMKAKHHIGLEKMEYPYYLSTKRLVLFSETDAMVIKLHGGLSGFLENCFNIDRDQ